VSCDFFCVGTVWLKTLYVLFFMELSTRPHIKCGYSHAKGQTHSRASVGSEMVMRVIAG